MARTLVRSGAADCVLVIGFEQVCTMSRLWQRGILMLTLGTLP